MDFQICLITVFSICKWVLKNNPEHNRGIGIFCILFERNEIAVQWRQIYDLVAFLCVCGVYSFYFVVFCCAY